MPSSDEYLLKCRIVATPAPLTTSKRGRLTHEHLALSSFAWTLFLDESRRGLVQLVCLHDKEKVAVPLLQRSFRAKCLGIRLGGNLNSRSLAGCLFLPWNQWRRGYWGHFVPPELFQLVFAKNGPLCFDGRFYASPIYRIRKFRFNIKSQHQRMNC